MSNTAQAQPTTGAPFSIRRAFFSDQPRIARVCSLAFWNDVLFGRLIHPHRDQYPHDSDLYWLRRSYVDWWDWSHIFIVAVDDKTNSVIGEAHWSRIADTDDLNRKAGWGLRRWDPRRLLKPLARLLMDVWAWFRPNRACDPAEEQIIELSYGYLDHIWTGNRSVSWYLESLAVLPEYQNAGVGRALVKWGLDKADEEGVACSVISAEGKERFYQRCGFVVGPVGWSGEGKGNPLSKVPGGEIYFREARWVRELEEVKEGEENGR